MEHYCTFNLGTGLWDAIVPISWHGIKKAPRESLGSYLRQPDAVAAVEEFFTFVTSTPKFGGMMARSEADDQTIKALRIRVNLSKRLTILSTCLISIILRFVTGIESRVANTKGSGFPNCLGFTKTGC